MPQENKTIRILQVLGRLDRGGAETLVMNLYRAMDRSRIQFDFVIHTSDECEYSEEIRSMGGKIHSMLRIQDVGPVRYKQEWKKFFDLHPEVAERILEKAINEANNLQKQHHSQLKELEEEHQQQVTKLKNEIADLSDQNEQLVSKLEELVSQHELDA